MGSQLVEMGIESTMARLGQTPVGLPRTHQRPDEVAAAALGLERL
jgi:hypothetical protein